jgi:L-ascorbate metabolism protein UlaG (beta-lactamase superfamily)
LVEYPSGLRVLFDPVFEDCCAPINMKSLKRFTPPPCEIEDIPFVDVVVISHNHYDHLSYPTVLRIAKKFPEAHFFAPLGNKVWFEKCGITKVTELDWWESRDVRLESKKPGSQAEGNETNKAVSVISSTHTGKDQGITATIGALPCQHISARTPFDKCKTLWASWSVESGGSKVYFAGYVQILITYPLSSTSHTDDYTATRAIAPSRAFPRLQTTTPPSTRISQSAPPLHKSASTAAPSISASSPLAHTSRAGCGVPCMQMQKTR